MDARQQRGFPVLWLTAVTVASVAAPAAAQSLREPPKLSASVAAGVALPVHGDIGFNGREWQVTVRREVSPHFVVEGFFDQWRRSFDDTFAATPFDDRGGVRFTGVAQHTNHVNNSIGVSALLQGTVGRLTVTGGGGPGWMEYRRKFRQELSGCESAAAQVCQPSNNTWRSSDVSLHGVLSADVRLTTQFSAFGRFKFTGPVSDFGSSHGSITAGVRVGIR